MVDRHSQVRQRMPNRPTSTPQGNDTCYSGQPWKGQACCRKKAPAYRKVVPELSSNFLHARILSWMASDREKGGFDP